jgi:copper chaperone CopZ
VRKALSAIPGIGVVEINPLTGGITVYYNHKTVNHEDIISLLERMGCCAGRQYCILG